MLLAKNKVALIDTMDTLRRFLKDRKLELCEKTKIAVFNKHGKEKKETWKWEREVCFKYLLLIEKVIHIIKII